jgi:hypothetical protein
MKAHVPKYSYGMSDTILWMMDVIRTAYFDELVEDEMISGMSERNCRCCGNHCCDDHYWRSGSDIRRGHDHNQFQ